MKVFLPTITGLVPSGMLHVITAFLDFCYLVWHLQIDESVLDQIDDAVNRFHQECHIFIELGIWDNFLLPRQHAIVHYHLMIQLFSAPNGLCSSITESKHIKAVKQPYHHSSQNNPLGEMILMNQWNDKLATAQVDFESHGMLTSVQGNPLPGRWQIPQAQANSQLLAASNEPSVPEVAEVDEEDVEGVTSEGDFHLPRCPGESFELSGRGQFSWSNNSLWISKNTGCTLSTPQSTSAQGAYPVLPLWPRKPQLRCLQNGCQAWCLPTYFIYTLCQNLSFRSCTVSCPQQPFWNWWYAPWIYLCDTLLEAWRCMTQLHLHWEGCRQGQIPCIGCCPSSNLPFVLPQHYQVLMHSCAVVHGHQRCTMSWYWYVDSTSWPLHPVSMLNLHYCPHWFYPSCCSFNWGQWPVLPSTGDLSFRFPSCLQVILCK